MAKITRRDMLKVIGASGIVFGGMSAKISGVDKFIDGKGFSNLGIEMDKSFGADTIKPGTIIDSGNYRDFPQLKELMPEHQYLRLKKGATRSDLPPIHVLPTRKLTLTKTEQEWAEKNKDVVKIDSKTHELVNYKAGRPFLEPKNADEVVWNFLVRPFYGDSMRFNKTTFTTLDKSDRVKVLEFSLWHRMMMERTTIPPVPEFIDNPEKVLWKQTSVFTKPYDVAGFALLRYAYKSLSKADDSWAYIPAIRRVRRFTGADMQDPLLGTDVTFDDYANFQQKVDFKNVFPEKVEEGNILVYTNSPEARFNGHKVKIDGRKLMVPGWEIRPTYKITFRIKDPNYSYGKRVIWVDKETYVSQYGEYYDQKDNLWRTWSVSSYWTPQGEHCWALSEIEDWINGSKTYLQFDAAEYNVKLDDNIFTREHLSKLSR